MLRVLALFFLSTVAADAADQGFFACLKLAPEQVAWFSRPGISGCCKLADGMPTRYERRSEGIFVPPFTEAVAQARACRDGMPWKEPKDTHDHWVQIPADRVLMGKSNPIGVAVIWWTEAAYDNGQQHTVLCFIPEADT